MPEVKIGQEGLKSLVAEVAKDFFDGKHEQLLADLRADEEKRAAELKKVTDELKAMRQGTMGPELREGAKDPLRFGKLAQALAQPHLGGGAPQDFAKKAGWEHIVKALGSSTLSGGGALVPPGWIDDFVEFLYNASVMRALGAMSLPLPGGALDFATGDTSLTVSWTGEVVATNETSPTVGLIKVVERHVQAVSALSNKLMRHAGDRVARMVQNDMVNGTATEVDKQAIIGTGTDAKPKGMLNWAIAANKFNETGVTTATVRADLSKALRLLMEQNIPMLKPGIVIPPRTWGGANALVGTGDNAAFPELGGGTWMGTPYKTTNNVPINTGTGLVKSRTFVADFAQLVFFEGEDTRITSIDGAAYVNASGTVVSAFSQDQTVTKVNHSVDFIDRHDGKSVAIIEEVTLGT